MFLLQMCADFTHLVALVILLQQMWKTRSCAGISGKSQILFALVFTTRYVDLILFSLAFNNQMMYLTVMKVVFIAASYTTVYLIYVKFRTTYEHNHDTFRVEFLVITSAVLALFIHSEFTVLEVLWTFSIYLEAVAIIPQLFMVWKTGDAENITSHYLFALGIYRALYLLKWIHRYIEEDYYEPIPLVAGIVQTLIYCDFFYLYVTKVLNGKKIQLPDY